MKQPTTSPTPFLLTLVLAVTLSVSGCTLLGLGAAAGATVGGCELLDQNEDDQVTQSELSAGLYDDWDANDDDTLTEAEFEAGVAQRDIYSDWSGEYDTWDANDDATLTEAEFETRIARDENTSQWLDDQCDSLGL